MGLDPKRDRLLMLEVAHESQSPPSHIQRTVLFISAMRHHAQALRDEGWQVDYISLTDKDNTQRFDNEIASYLLQSKANTLACIEPGDHRVLGQIEAA
ncbi:MAG: cryptochrome/photolyase family protein, partial [Erythrobacter sp.]|nr:cryptochrome/photolyase family protein [Erythrobacter sp.]